MPAATSSRQRRSDPVARSPVTVQQAAAAAAPSS